MAGAASDDNPVGINVTAMVDVIFCLCLFFMCSLHFKQLEGKIDSWLPQEHGNLKAPPKTFTLEDIRVSLRWHSSADRAIRRVGDRPPVSGDPQPTTVI